MLLILVQPARGVERFHVLAKLSGEAGIHGVVVPLHKGEEHVVAAGDVLLRNLVRAIVGPFVQELCDLSSALLFDR